MQEWYRGNIHAYCEFTPGEKYKGNKKSEFRESRSEWAGLLANPINPEKVGAGTGFSITLACTFPLPWNILRKKKLEVMDSSTFTIEGTCLLADFPWDTSYKWIVFLIGQLGQESLTTL